MSAADLRDLLVSPDWHNQAACRGLPVSIFYGQNNIQAGLNVCRQCPVVSDCLRAGLEEEQKLPRSDVVGVRGGLPARTRLRLLKLIPHEYRPVAQCGTDAGYSRHQKQGTPYCDPCRHAHAAAKRERRLRETDAA